MFCKIVLLTATLVVAGSSKHLLAQEITATRAHDLYVDFDRTQVCPNCNQQLPCLDIYGWKGQPYRDKRPGGCRCGKKKGLTWYNGYHHWPTPWSFLLDHGRDGARWGRDTDTTCPRLRDKLDVLANLRLSQPVRNDNGYFGHECEPYGLVGKSRRGVVVDGSHLPSQAAVRPSAHVTATQPINRVAPGAGPVNNPLVNPVAMEQTIAPVPSAPTAPANAATERPRWRGPIQADASESTERIQQQMMPVPQSQPSPHQAGLARQRQLPTQALPQQPPRQLPHLQQTQKAAQAQPRQARTRQRYPLHHSGTHRR